MYQAYVYCIGRLLQLQFRFTYSWQHCCLACTHMVPFKFQLFSVKKGFFSLATINDGTTPPLKPKDDFKACLKTRIIKV